MTKVIPPMDSTSTNIVADNISKLKALFPEAFTEGKVDFEALKEVLGDYVDGRDERYSFTWNGKSKARMIAQTPSTGTLRPCKEESVDWYSTQNLFIEGDNLEVLKLLQKSYHKKVKMIYIDPPYNTGKDFVYKDNFKDNIKNYKEVTGQVDGEGRNLFNNPETSGRYHTDWLNMMYPRLKLARNLLKDDGVIFISIDDNEVTNLRKICDEIFGEENFVGQFTWETKRAARGVPPKTLLMHNHEYILCYAKNIENLKFSGLQRDEADFGNADNDSRGLWRSESIRATGGQDNYFTIVNPNNGYEYHGNWAFSQSRIEQMIKDNLILFPKDRAGTPRQKKFIDSYINATKAGVTSLGWHSTETATNQLLEIFDQKKLFDFPKPLSLIGYLVNQALTQQDILLDFFAGSSTTAHAVMQLNAKDRGNRKFIMVQLPETTGEKTEAYKTGYKTIAEISKERIRRAAANIKAENPECNGDLGFKTFKLDSTNIKPWELDFDLTAQDLEDQISNIKPDRKDEDVLYEVLLKYGLDLTLPITEHSIDGHKVFNIGMGALMVCLSDKISLEVAEGIAKLKEELNPEIMRVVFKDAGFADDVVKTNALQILKQAGIEDVRSL